MVDNTLVVAQHGLADDLLVAWFTEHVCEVAGCRSLLNDAQSARSAGDARLVELMLENELEIAVARFTRAFPDAAVRRAAAADFAAAPAGDDVVIRLQLGAAPGMPAAVTLRPGVGRGTGAKLWTGGILLAEWLARGAGGLCATADARQCAPVKLQGMDVLELGAGCTALPAIVAARRGARSVVSTDLHADLVRAMEANLARNGVLATPCSARARGVAEARVLDWLTVGRAAHTPDGQFDVILFADGIYTERGAFLLADAVKALLRPGGCVVGALPDLRVGVRSFEADLRACGFAAAEAVLDRALLDATTRAHREYKSADVIVGESAEGYRIVVWRQDASEEGCPDRAPKEATR